MLLLAPSLACFYSLLPLHASTHSHCSEQHLPGFLAAHDKLKAQGIDIIACISVNDPFVMAAWGKQHNVEDKVVMIADGNGTFTEAVGQLVDETSYEMGMRSERYAAVFNEQMDCIYLGKDDLSFAENILDFLAGRASERAPEPRQCQCDIFT